MKPEIMRQLEKERRDYLNSIGRYIRNAKIVLFISAIIIIGIGIYGYLNS